MLVKAFLMASICNLASWIETKLQSPSSFEKCFEVILSIDQIRKNIQVGWVCRLGKITRIPRFLECASSSLLIASLVVSKEAVREENTDCSIHCQTMPAEGPPHPLQHPWWFDVSVSPQTLSWRRFEVNLGSDDNVATPCLVHGLFQ